MKFFVETILLNLVEKTMSLNVQPTLVGCLSATYKFNVWMSKIVHDIFVVVVNFISNDWRAKHVSTIDLFEVIHTSDIAMVLKLQELLYRFVLTKK
jgi:hypothetical protein